MPGLLGKVVLLGCLLMTGFRSGDKAPAFVLSSTDGQTVSLGDLRGKLVYLSFVDTSCYHCREEIPVLNKISKEQPSSIAIYVIMFGANTREKAMAMKTEMGIQVPVLYDPSGQTSGRYGVVALPWGFLLDEKGQISSIYQGFQEAPFRAQVSSEVNRLARLKRNCSIFIAPFSESTESAKQEKLGTAYKSQLEQALVNNGYVIAPSEISARFVITGSVAKLKSITGFSLSMENELFGKSILDENFSLTDSDLTPVVSKITDKLSPSCPVAPVKK